MHSPTDSSFAPARRRILLLHTGALGDVILLARYAGAAAPEAELTLACHAAKARMLRSLGAVDAWVDVESLPLGDLFTADARGQGALSAALAGYDELLSCFGVGDAGIESRLAALVDRCRFLPPRPVESPGMHLLEHWSVIDGRGLNWLDARRWRVPEHAVAEAAVALGRAGVEVDGGYLAAHVGAGSRDKCWPVENFVALAGALPLPTVFLCGEVERERLAGEDFARLTSAGTVLDDLSLERLAAVLWLSAGFVGNDSGPAHLAGSLGTPATVLFGPTDATCFSPRMPDGRRTQCLCGADGAIGNLRVGEVSEAVAAMPGFSAR